MKEDLFHMPVKIGNIELRNPFIVASGPTAKRVDQLELAEKNGWGAASIKQTFNPYPYINYEPRYRCAGWARVARSTFGRSGQERVPTP